MKWLFAAALILIVAGVFGLVANSYVQCHSAGGTFVRGLFWFVCLKKGDTSCPTTAS